MYYAVMNIFTNTPKQQMIYEVIRLGVSAIWPYDANRQ